MPRLDKPYGFRTRAICAAELLAMIERGPSINPNPPGNRGPLTEAELAQHYRLWAQSWVLPPLRYLLARDLPAPPAPIPQPEPSREPPLTCHSCRHQQPRQGTEEQRCDACGSGEVWL